MLPPKVMGLHTLYVFILFYEQPPTLFAFISGGRLRLVSLCCFTVCW